MKVLAPELVRMSVSFHTWWLVRVCAGIFRSQMNIQVVPLILWSQYKHLFRPRGGIARHCKHSDVFFVLLQSSYRAADEQTYQWHSGALSLLYSQQHSCALHCLPPMVHWPVSALPAVPSIFTRARFVDSKKTESPDLLINHLAAGRSAESSPGLTVHSTARVRNTAWNPKASNYL